MPKQTDLTKIATVAEKLDSAINAWNVLHRKGTVAAITLTPTDGPPVALLATGHIAERLRADLAGMFNDAATQLIALGVEPKEPPATMVEWAAKYAPPGKLDGPVSS